MQDSQPLRHPAVHRSQALVLALTGALLLCGCESGEPDAAAPAADASADERTHGTEAVPTATDDAVTTTAPAPEPALPDTPSGEHAGWVLHHLDLSSPPPSVTEIGERFDQTFQDEVSPAEMLLVFGQLRQAGPYTVIEVVTSELMGPGTVQVRLEGTRPLLMTLTVSAEGQIGGLVFAPDEPLDVPDVGSWEDLDRELAELGLAAQTFVGRVSDGVCRPVHTGADAAGRVGEPMPTGSVFKLLVLSALVDAIDDGNLAWDDELTITAEVKSLPSGRLQLEPDSSTVPVREAARLMIAISDNTATDLLVEALGRDRLEAALPELGVEDPERLTPFLTTRELFLLGWGAPPEVREQWADADPAERRGLLSQLPDALSSLDPAAITAPVWQDGVDWFLTGQEICSVHARLQQQAATEAGAPVRDVLSESPGLEPPASTAYLGFKGGSAPGVLATSFYLERSGQEPGAGSVLVVLTASDRLFDQRDVLGAVQAGLELLTEE